MQKFVYEFTEGGKDEKDLLGGKGANLAEMTRLGLPVPPGFTVTTEACRQYLADGAVPPELRVQVTRALRRAGGPVGRQLGDPQDPLLVSVRSGAKFSMPGMMETVLNIGLNDASVRGLAAVSGDERFAWDSYRRLVQMFGKTVLDIDGELFADAMDSAKRERGRDQRRRPRRGRPRGAGRDLQEGGPGQETGRAFPQHPREQLDLAIVAVFDSWNTDRARLYRRRERIPHDLGTAVNVCTMVFGNLGADSGTGVCFTRDPATGKQGVYGDYLPNAQGEDVVAGIRNTLTLDDLAELDPASREAADRGDAPAGDPLPRPVRHRVHRRARQAVDAADPGRQAHGRGGVPDRRPARRRAADHPGRGAGAGHRRAAGAADVPAVRPVGASGRCWPRAWPPRRVRRSGAAVFDSATAVARHAARRVGGAGPPGDQPGRPRGHDRRGRASSPAGAARPATPRWWPAGWARPASAGPRRSTSTPPTRTARVGDIVINEGDVIAIDGSTGEVFLGDVPVVPSPVAPYLEEGLDAALDGRRRGDRRRWSGRSTGCCATPTPRRRLRVRANADTAEDAARARRARRAGHRAVPHRAHVPRRPPGADRTRDPGRRRRGARRGAGGAAAAAAGGLHRAARRRWTGCR